MGRFPPRVHNRVLALLVLAGLAAAWGLAFLKYAPNRLVSGAAISLVEVLASRFDASQTLALLGILVPALL
ncbi:MAG: hypothetical protein ABIR13_00280, partial [Polaromonas sp.]